MYLLIVHVIGNIMSLDLQPTYIKEALQSHNQVEDSYGGV